MSKIQSLKEHLDYEDRTAQRLYRRRKRKESDGSMESNWSVLIESSALDD